MNFGRKSLAFFKARKVYTGESGGRGGSLKTFRLECAEIRLLLPLLEQLLDLEKRWLLLTILIVDRVYVFLLEFQ